MAARLTSSWAPTRVLTTSRLFAPLAKETSSESVASYQLLVRAGFIRKSSAGVYNLLPLALRVLEKLEALVDEELRSIGGQKIAMPTLLSAELWKKTGRWETSGQELFRLVDRKDAQFCLAPTHEEEVTSLVAREISSHRQLPLRLYQTSRKFRDEIRPRFGLMRGREFVMKDMYTFDESETAAMETYKEVCDSYHRIFQRLGLPFVQAEADTGNIGGSLSHEFQLLSEIGEDQLLVCPCGKYAANVERAVCEARSFQPEKAIADQNGELLQKIKQTAEKQLHHRLLPLDQLRLQLVSWPHSNQRDVVLLRSDHSINIHKIKRLFPEQLTEPECDNHVPNSVDERPVNVLVDLACFDSSQDNFKNDGSLNTAPNNFIVAQGDFRLASSGDFCSCPPVFGTSALMASPNQVLKGVRGIEVGHAFYLGNKYSRKLDALFQDGKGQINPIEMGCFGLGISRIIAAVVEISHDKDGIIWPVRIAPYRVCIIIAGSPRHEQDYEKLQAGALLILNALEEHGLRGEIIVDDRDATTTVGVRFKEAQLIGYPFMVVVGRQYLTQGKYEVQTRASGTVTLVTVEEACKIVS